MTALSNSSKTQLKGRSVSLLAAALFATFALGSSAHAANIVADPGFEAAGGGNVYASGSSIDGGSWTVTQGAVYIDNLDPWVYASSNSVNLTGANLYVPNSLTQDLTTVVGQTYSVSFWANADISNTFSLDENGIAVAGAPTSIVQNGFPDQVDVNGNKSLFVDYTGSFIAASTTTDLTFTATGDPAINSQNYSVMIDNVSVSPTPEPGSIVLLLTGIVGMGLLVGRKRLVSAI